MKSVKRKNQRVKSHHIGTEDSLTKEHGINVSLRIDGMTCVNCQNKIERKLLHTSGIASAKVRYSTGTAKVTYDPNQITMREIDAVIEQLNYRVRKGRDSQGSLLSRVVSFFIIIVALYVLCWQFGVLNLLVPSQLADAKMGYGMLFVIGLITSVHCLAMCGGINLSQCLPKPGAREAGRLATFVPAGLYNLGRVISYTVIGFVLGLAGFLLGGGSSVGLPTMLQGVLKLAAGVFMVIMGVGMLGLFPGLRRFTLRMPGFLARKVDAEKMQNRSPFIVGLLNGLMPCGPLQSMQIVALASGNPFAGAFAMLLFSLGTVPLMLGFGSIVSALGKKFTQKVMTVGAVLVVVMGLAMLSQGGSLSGFLPPERLFVLILALCAAGIVSCISFRNPSYKMLSAAGAFAVVILFMPLVLSLSSVNGFRLPFSSEIEETSAASNIPIVDGKQIVNSTLAPGKYPNITVQVGTPVRWTIDAPEGTINGCNNRMLIRGYGIEYSLNTGENVIEFTPTKVGTDRYSCWMGMIRGTITVVEKGAQVDVPDPDSESKENGTVVQPSFSQSSSQSPSQANVSIPTENLAIAEIGTIDMGEVQDYKIQRVRIDMTDDGYSPAIIVVEAGTDVEWTIDNRAAASENFTMRVPLYSTILELIEAENQLYLFPTEDFAFSNGDHTIFGYVKVVDDINAVDVDAIRAEVAAYKTLIYPESKYAGAEGGSPSCH